MPLIWDLPHHGFVACRHHYNERRGHTKTATSATGCGLGLDSGEVECVFVESTRDTCGADAERRCHAREGAPSDSRSAGGGQASEAGSIGLERPPTRDVEGGEGEVIVSHGIVSKVEEVGQLSVRGQRWWSSATVSRLSAPKLIAATSTTTSPAIAAMSAKIRSIVRLRASRLVTGVGLFTGYTVPTCA